MRAIVSILVYEVKAFRQVDQWIGAGDSFRARTGVDPRYGKPSLVPLLSHAASTPKSALDVTHTAESDGHPDLSRSLRNLAQSVWPSRVS